MSENRRNPLRNLALAGAGSVLALLFALAQGGAAQRPGAGSRTVRGVVDRFTTAKKGEVDGCVLEDGTWVHWPPHQGERVAPLLAKGDRIRVTGRTEIGKKGEAKFEAELIVNLRTDRAITLDDDGPPRGKKGPKGKGKGPRVAAGDLRTLRGVVDRLTTAPKGEVDGFVMDDGTWVHWPPHLADRVAGAFRKGDRVRVSGRLETGPKGDTKFEAQSITNLRSDRTVSFDDGPGTPPLREVAGDREERLRALERRLDELLREVQRLRREE